MYDIVKNVILNKKFELSDILRKIGVLWLEGELDDDQKSELIELARENADPAMSNDLAARLDDHEARLRKLEEKASEGGTEPSEEYPEFQPNHVYIKGDKVTFEGKKYECILNEYTDRTTWSPKDYPPYWKAVE